MLSSGTADYNDMVEKNGILVAEDIAQVGDTLKIEAELLMVEPLMWKPLL